MKTVTIVTPGYNEEHNLLELREKIRGLAVRFPDLRIEHLYIDNASSDGSSKLLRDLAQSDRSLKVIFNARNFGHIRSPYHAILQCKSDAVVLMASDLQDPPELVAEFIEEWKKGTKICVAIKSTSEESRWMFWLRKKYYQWLTRVSDSPQIENFTGFGLYDKAVVDQMRKFKDPYPFFRGIVAEIGFSRKEFEFKQPLRKRGLTKNNFYTLYDIGMLGLINYSKLPLRLAVFVGFLTAVLSLLFAFGYLIYKLMFWNSFQVGVAPVIIGVFLIGAIQLIFLGVIGEYVGVILTQVRDRPLVIESERLNMSPIEEEAPGNE